MKSWVFGKINENDKPLARLRTKDSKSDMKEETLQLILQKYEGSQETTMNNYRSTNWLT